MEWQLRVEDVEVGGQHRKELGDLTELVVSIAEVGMIHPLILDPDGLLISGARRLAACRELNESHVAVMRAEHLAQACEAMAEEIAEETGQAPMKVVEKISLGKQLEKLPRLPKQGDTRYYVSKALGIGERSWEYLRTIAEAIDHGELEEEVLEDIDRTGRIKPMYDALMRLREGEPEPDQSKKPFVITSDRHRLQAEKDRERLAKAVGGLDGYRMGLEDRIDVQKVLAVADPSEIAAWRLMLGKTILVLNKLRNDLEEGAAK